MDARRAENERTVDLCTDYWQPEMERERKIRSQMK